MQRSIARSTVASCDRSLRPTTDRTIKRGNSGTKRPIVRSIVASCDRSYNQSCDYRAASIHNWWCYHVLLVVRARRTYFRLFLDTTRLNCREQIGLRHFSVHCADGTTYTLSRQEPSEYLKAATLGQDYKEKYKLDSKQISNSPC